MTKKINIHILITLVFAGILIPFLGNFYLFDWDEINFAESAREMIMSKNYLDVQINFEPFYEKPPLFIWLQALSFKIFGVSEFAARFPNALIGIIFFNLLYHIGRKVHGHFFGIFWVIGYALGIIPILYFKSGIIDPFFNVLLMLTFYQLYLYEAAIQSQQKPQIHVLLSAFFLGLAVLTKGPVAVLLIVILAIVRFLVNGKNLLPSIGTFLLGLLVFFATISIWYIPQFLNKGIVPFLQYHLDLFKGQIDWHNQPFYYHFIVLIFACFPMSIIAIPSFKGNTFSYGKEFIFQQYQKLIFAIVLLVFSIVQTKIIHYSSYCWIPLSYLAANTMYKLYTNRAKKTKIIAWIFICISFVNLVVFGFILYATEINKLVLTKIIVSDVFFKSILLTHWNFGLPFSVVSITWCIICIIVGFRWLRNNTISWGALLVSTIVLSSFIYFFALPKANNNLQAEMINEIKTIAKNKENYICTDGFKSYAIAFYGNLNSAQTHGPWDNAWQPEGKRSSNANRKREYLLSKPIAQKTFFITKNNYKPSAEFLLLFTTYKIAKPYIIWKVK